MRKKVSALVVLFLILCLYLQQSDTDSSPRIENQNTLAREGAEEGGIGFIL